MRTIRVSDRAFEELAVLGRRWKTASASETVEELLDRVSADSTDKGPEAPSQIPLRPTEDVQIYSLYRNTWVPAVYHRPSGHVVVGLDELADQVFRSPSGAAKAVVKLLTPEVDPNRNGWSFWLIEGTSEPLNSLRQKRPAAASA